MKQVKNRNKITSVGYPMALAAMLSMVMAPVGTALAQDNTATSPTTDGKQSLTSSQANNAPTATEKSETVYVFAKADGTTKSTTVSDALKNVDSTEDLADSSTLTDITNVSGSEEFSGAGSNMVWAANGKDIYYSGKTDQAAPVQMKVTYELDGKEIDPDSLVGKSGKLTMRFDFTNTAYEDRDVNGAIQRIYTPFICATGMILDNDNFKNVEVSSGKVLDDGDRATVLGIAAPGLTESLDLDDDVDLGIGDSFEVTADVTDFEMESTITFVSSDYLKNLDTSDFDTQDITSSMNQLQDAMNQLIDGSSELADGLAQLSDGATELSDGANSANDGAHQLADGAASATDGASQLADGTKQAYDGTQQLSSASNQVNDGLKQLRNGTSTATGLVDALQAIGAGSTNESTLYGGTMKLKAGTSQLKAGVNQLKGNPADTSDSLYAAKNGADAIQAGATSLSGGTQTAITAIENQMIPALTDAENNLKTGDMDKAVGSLKDAQATLESLSKDANDAADSLNSIATTLGSVDLSAMKQGVDTARDQASSAVTDIQGINVSSALQAQATLAGIDQTGMTDAQKQALNSAISELGQVNAASAQKAATEAGTAAYAAGQVSDGITAAQSNIADLTQQIQAEAKQFQDAGTQLQTDAATLKSITDNAADFTKLATASAEVQGVNNGLKTMVDQSSASSLYAAKHGADQIAAGAGSISSGMTDAISAIDNQMNPGFNQLDAGYDALASGLTTLANGGTSPDGRTSAGLSGAVKALGTETTPGTLIYGTDQISQNMFTLVTAMYNIADGAGQLSDGAQQLSSGASQLADGTQQLSDGAVQLADGAQSAYDGSQQLADGLVQFNDEGISKITELGDTLSSFKTRMDILKEVGDDHTNFSGITEGTQGSVKYIYETDALKQD